MKLIILILVESKLMVKIDFHWILKPLMMGILMSHGILRGVGAQVVTSHAGGLEIDLKEHDFGEQHDILVHGSEIRGAPAGTVNMDHFFTEVYMSKVVFSPDFWIINSTCLILKPSVWSTSIWCDIINPKSDPFQMKSNPSYRSMNVLDFY